MPAEDPADPQPEGADMDGDMAGDMEDMDGDMAGEMDGDMDAEMEGDADAPVVGMDGEVVEDEEEEEKVDVADRDHTRDPSKYQRAESPQSPLEDLGTDRDVHGLQDEARAAQVIYLNLNQFVLEL